MHSANVALAIGLKGICQGRIMVATIDDLFLKTYAPEWSSLSFVHYTLSRWARASKHELVVQNLICTYI